MPSTRRRFRTGTDRCLSRQPVGAQGLPQSKQGQWLKPLTCTFAPLAGLEPAPYGLEIRRRLSGWYCSGASPQVESRPSSDRSHPDRGRDNDRIANGIASEGGRHRPERRADRQPACANRRRRQRMRLDGLQALRLDSDAGPTGPGDALRAGRSPPAQAECPIDPVSSTAEDDHQEAACGAREGPWASAWVWRG
jgi:hypothetical protein